MSSNGDTKGRRFLGGPMLMVGLIASIVAAVVWANLWKSDMKVKEISVAGNSILSEKEVLSLANIGLGQRLYNVDLQAAQKRVVANAFVRTAAVNREAPDRIAITLTERVPITAVVLDKIEYLDAEGVVLPPSRSENIFDLPVLTGAFQATAFVPGKQITRGDLREALAILEMARQLSDDLYRRISEVHVEQNKDIVLYTAEYGVPVIFGRGDDAVKLVKLDGFWKEIVPHRGAQDLAYIDLRFEDQVVVRWNYDAADGQTQKSSIVKSVREKKS